MSESTVVKQKREKVEDAVDQCLPEVIEIRRDIHQHPELGFKEHRTSLKVTNWLERCGIKFDRVAETGIVGLLHGGEHGKTVLLRADMDALPVTEDTGVPYESASPGIAHACGHDGHTAILMGAAKVLSELRNDMRGNVKFVFQPAEEGGGGGEKMCQENVLENPHVDAAFALHGWPDLLVGQIGLKYGVMMANADRFEVTVYGKGGHAARPHKAIDPIVMAAQVIDGFQTIVSRRKNPLAPAVITVGRIQGGSTHNVIPDSVSLWGTVRTLDEDTRTSIFDSMKRVVESVSYSFGAQAPKLQIIRGYPATVNDDRMVRFVEEIAGEMFGDNVKLIQEPSMGGEDFSYYLQRVPGAMFRLGVSSGNSSASLHSAKFNFNDEAIRTGMLMMANIAIEFLNR